MRCFVALELGEETKERLEKLVEELEAFDLDASFAKREQLHITLAFLGELSESDAKENINALKKMFEETSFSKFKFELRGVGFFPNEKFIRVVWTGVGAGKSELKKLQAEVAKALNYSESRLFTPHVALARIKTKRNVENLFEFKKHHADEFFAVSNAGCVAFKKSMLTPEGPVYEDLARIELK